MASSNVIVKGMRELSNQLRAFDKEMHAELKSTLKEAAKEVSVDAKNTLTRPGGIDTGAYKQSISFRVSKSGLIAWAYAKRGKETSQHGYIGHLLEYGTKKNKAIPHFGPALDKMKAVFGGRLEKAVSRVRPQL